MKRKKSLVSKFRAHGEHLLISLSMEFFLSWEWFSGAADGSVRLGARGCVTAVTALGLWATRRTAPREELRPGGQAVPPGTGLLRSARACSSVTLSRGTHLPFELSVTPRLYKVHFPFFCVIKVHMCIIKNLAKVTVMK